MEPISSIVLGGGCFWCTEAIFRRVKGVINVTAGYAGGHSKAPTYDSVSSGSTGHAEVIKVDFNPTQISLKELLEIFFATHDPTTLNRQGADIGTQYRSIILANSPEQLAAVKNFLADSVHSASSLAPISHHQDSVYIPTFGKSESKPAPARENAATPLSTPSWSIGPTPLSAPITTEIKLLEAFYPAEISHQEYYERQTSAPYCQIVIAPKIAKFLQQFKDKAKSH